MKANSWHHDFLVYPLYDFFHDPSCQTINLTELARMTPNLAAGETGNYSTTLQSMIKDSRICSYEVPKYKDRKRKKKEDLKDENWF